MSEQTDYYFNATNELKHPHRYSTDDHCKKWFFKKIQRTDYCWLWRGSMVHDGYGRTSFRSKRKRAHRLMWEIVNGPIPENLVVMHRCDVRNCVNPEHLNLGTMEENIMDAAQKGRMWATGEKHWAKRMPHRIPKGERCGSSINTEKTVKKIRRDYSSGKHTYSTLGLKYHIDRTTVAQIITRRTWKHI